MEGGGGSCVTRHPKTLTFSPKQNGPVVGKEGGGKPRHLKLPARMEAARPAQPDAGGLFSAVAKIVRFRRATGRGKGGAESVSGLVSDDGGIEKGGFSQCLDSVSAVSRSEYAEEDKEKKRRQQQAWCREALLAELFAGVSAIKAAYAQLQIAQSPYNPDAIQSADAAVVSELKQLSQLKASHLRRQQVYDGAGQPSGLDTRLLAEAQEKRNLLKTFQISAKKLEDELRRKDSEVLLLRSQLDETEAMNRWIEEKLHQGRSLRALDALHLSALDPTHFLAALRYAVRSARAFVRLLAKEMERAGWDLDAAAGAISPEVLRGNPEHRAFAFESYVCRTMFSSFQSPDFGLAGGYGVSPPERRRFFEEFLRLKSATSEEILHGVSRDPAFTGFCRAKYLALVHPKMEGSFFGSMNHRNLVGSGGAFPGTQLFLGFAEMARRVWLLHRLFFSFDREARAAIFHVRWGCRFSEVYMESVVEDAEGWSPVVGFTVVPGFVVGKTVIQCRVYPARMAAQRQR